MRSLDMKPSILGMAGMRPPNGRKLYWLFHYRTAMMSLENAIMLSTLVASTFLFVALVITALEPSLTARSVRLIKVRRPFARS